MKELCFTSKHVNTGCLKNKKKKKGERMGSYFLQPLFGSPLPAAKLSAWRGQDDRDGEQNTNLLESSQNLSSEEPTGSVSLFSLIACWGRGKAACHGFNCREHTIFLGTICLIVITNIDVKTQMINKYKTSLPQTVLT